ncbi:hypothetical protein BH10BAC5_BH10BAC5_06940 [soil metagenome]
MIRNVLISIYMLISLQSYSQTLQWQAIPNAPFDIDRQEDLMFINSQTGWVININGQVYKTTNGGSRFDNLQTNLQVGLRSIGFLDENIGIAGTLNFDHPMFRTTNGGNNWSPVTNIPSSRYFGICGITQLPPNTFYAVGVYTTPAIAIKSTDRGLTWINLNVDTTNANRLVDTYFFDPLHGFIVGGKSSTNLFYSKPVVAYTSDGGASWQIKYTSNTVGYLCWKIDFRTPEFGYVSLENFGIPAACLTTTDGGMNWNYHSLSNAPELDVEGIGFIDQNTGWLGGRSGNGTYQTTNAGINWAAVTFGKNLNRFQFISDTLAYSCGQTVYKYSRTTEIQQISSIVPENFKLEQNYPNPFNPVTKIKFSIKHVSHVILKIYDISGKEIITLVNEKLNAGEYESNFTGKDYSSGVYIIKITADDYSDVKRMMLVK